MKLLSLSVQVDCDSLPLEEAGSTTRLTAQLEHYIKKAVTQVVHDIAPYPSKLTFHSYEGGDLPIVKS